MLDYPLDWKGRLLGPTLIYIDNQGSPIELRLNDEQVQLVVDDWNCGEILNSEIGEKAANLSSPRPRDV
jgi:hypothetical protein